MEFNIRPLKIPEDFAGLAVLLNQVRHEPTTAEQLADWQRAASPERIRQRVVAVDASDRIVGWGDAGHDPWMPDGYFWVEASVEPACRGRGLGGRLYDAAMEFTRAQSAVRLQAEVHDDSSEGMRFAKQRGFAVQRHLFESSLDPAAFDETPFADAIATAEASGIRFFSFADIADTEEHRRKLHELNRDTVMDIPGWEGGFADFAQFQTMVFGADWYTPDGQIVAAEGERWVGMAALAWYRSTNSFYNNMTGVLREFRGRKIALALKLLSIRVARSHGAAYIRTSNDSENAPMLAINRKLGYTPRPGIYKCVRPAEG